MNKVSFIKALLEMDEASFTKKYNDDPKLKGGQKNLPDQLQAQIVKKEDKYTDQIDSSELHMLKKLYSRTPTDKIKAMIDKLKAKLGINENIGEDIKTRVGGIVFKKTGNTNGSKVEYQPYSLIDKKNVDTAFYYYPEDIQQRANDYTAPKGGTISTQLEGEDHEVSMAQNSLKSIISAASQLMNSLGQDEKDIPAWIQDHITNAENFINQASKNYHEYNEGATSEYDMDALPDGTKEKLAGDQEDKDEMFLKNMMEHLFEGKKAK
jgi:hypothetical protein